MAGVLIVDEIQAPEGSEGIRLKAPLLSSEGASLLDAVSGNVHTRFSSFEDGSIPYSKLDIPDGALKFSKLEEMPAGFVTPDKMTQIPYSKVTVNDGQIPFAKLTVPLFSILPNRLAPVPYDKITINENEIELDRINIPSQSFTLDHIIIPEASIDYDRISIANNEITFDKLDIPHKSFTLDHIEIANNSIDYSLLTIANNAIELSKINIPNQSISIDAVVIPDGSIDFEKVNIPTDSIELSFEKSKIANNSIALTKLDFYEGTIPDSVIPMSALKGTSSTSHDVEAVYDANDANIFLGYEMDNTTLGPGVRAENDQNQQFVPPQTTKKLQEIHIAIRSAGSGSLHMPGFWIGGAHLYVPEMLDPETPRAGWVLMTIGGIDSLHYGKVIDMIAHWPHVNASGQNNLNDHLFQSNEKKNWIFLYTYGNVVKNADKVLWFNESYNAPKYAWAAPQNGAYLGIYRNDYGWVHEDYSPYSDNRRNHVSYVNKLLLF